MRDACWFGAKHDISAPQGRPIRTSCQVEKKKMAKALKAGYRKTHAQTHTHVCTVACKTAPLKLPPSEGCVQADEQNVVHYCEVLTHHHHHHYHHPHQWAKYQWLAASSGWGRRSKPRSWCSRGFVGACRVW